MNRIVYFELDGVKYPLCASLGAVEEILELTEKRGGAGKERATLATNIDSLAILMKYGTARVKRLCPEDEAPEPLTREQLQEMLFQDEYIKACEMITKAYEVSKKHEIDGKPNGKKKVK